MVNHLFLTISRLALAGEPHTSISRDSNHKYASADGKGAYIARFITYLNKNEKSPCLLTTQDARKKPFTEDSALLVEIFHLLLSGQSPSHLAHLLVGEESECTGIPESVVSRRFSFHM